VPIKAKIVQGAKKISGGWAAALLFPGPTFRETIINVQC